MHFCQQHESNYFSDLPEGFDEAMYFKQTVYNVSVKIKCSKPSNDIKGFMLVIYSVKRFFKKGVMLSCVH